MNTGIDGCHPRALTTQCVVQYHEWRCLESEVTGTVGTGPTTYSRYYCVYCREIVTDVKVG